MRSWHGVRRAIAGLDPVADNERIAHLSLEVRYGDPLLTAALYTVAFVRQMAVPSIADVVHRNGRGPIMRDTRKRNDDTMVFFGEFMKNGYSSERGRAAIERLNQIHAPFPITNDQSLYTLASLAFEPDRIPRHLGVRLLTPAEKSASYHFWHGVGTTMGLHDIPATYDEFYVWMLNYEQANWGYSTGGAAVANTMIDDYAARWLPRPLQFVAREFIATLCEDELLDALHIKKPRAASRKLAKIALQGYAFLRRVLPDAKERSWTDTYGAAYSACPHLSEVGYKPRH